MTARARETEEDDLGEDHRGHHPREDVGRAAVPLLQREVGRDPTRADVRAAHAVLAQLVVEGSREADLAELRRAVHRLAREPASAASEATVTRSPFSAGDQVRYRRARCVDRALQVDVDHLLEVLDRRVHQRVVGADARVRDADVELPEALHGARDGVFDLTEGADVARETECRGESQIVSTSRGEAD